jgi:ABC-type branched-subunit amino acid transport system substrate-binding protein
MQERALIRLLALLAVIALAVAACADDDAADDEDATDVDVEEPDDDEEEDDADLDEPDDADEVDRGDGTLRLGYILPETGQLQFLGPPMIAATEFAVEQINEAGGVLDADVELSSGDEAGDTSIASETAERLLGEGVDAIIGAAATGMTLAIIDQVTGAEVVQCSPSNTGPGLTDYDDGGFYFRTAPTDALQGPVLAETIVGDGHTEIALAARADDYGEGLLDATVEALEEQGASAVESVLYDPEAASFDSEVEQLVGADPDAIALIAFDESAQILQGLIEQGSGPGDFPVYGAESLRSAELPELVDPGDPNVLDGLTGTAPASDADEAFIEDLQEFRELDDTLFSAESYDCVTLVALAAEAAGSDDPAVFVDEMVNVTRGDAECSSFEECKQLIEDGEEIAYRGVSGIEELTDDGEPDRGLYEVWEFTDGEIETLDEIESSL